KSDNDSSKKVNLSTIGVEKMIVLKSTLKQIENQLFNSFTPNDSMLFIKQLAILARKAMI
ncbi:MAG: MarR family transcriptional regulator, partial [Lactobacillus sp.]|nr:MarR family transcriptional regulator [Lactobacillus sp.]